MITLFTRIQRRMSRTIKRTIKHFCLIQGVISLVIVMYVLMHNTQDAQDATSAHTNITGLHNVSFDAMKQIKENSLVSSWIRYDNQDAYTLFRFDRILSRQGKVHYHPPRHPLGPYKYFSKGAGRPDMPVWALMKTEYCEGCCITYARRMIYLRDVTIHPEYCHGKAGGETLDDVIGQSEHVEYLRIEKGFFTADSPTDFTFKYAFEKDLLPLTQGLLVKKTNNELLIDRMDVQDDIFTIITIRYDYANLYHSMMNFYDIFFIMIVLKLQPSEVKTIWLDAHPQSDLDHTWETLFGQVARAGSIKAQIRYRHMILNGIGSSSHLNQHDAPDLPYAEEFRHFVLSRFEVADKHERSCISLRITIIWRRHYVAHPRNPNGRISRQFGNEYDVYNDVSSAVPSATVTGVQLDTLSMQKQLELITQTDILIGIHGAGLSHILFLPKSAGVIELYPTSTSLGNAHFRSMARWRRIPYISWKNNYAHRETERGTIVSSGVLKEMVQTMKDNIC